MHGFIVSPWSFCWALEEEKIRELMKHEQENLMNVMVNVYRGTDVIYPGERELEQARSYSRKFLEISLEENFAAPELKSMIENELRHPWMARMDHLEHRMWIEENNNSSLWMGKISHNRISSNCNDKLLHLAKRNYKLRQSIYVSELEELKEWSKKWGLSEMGFGREKTTYCYFAVAASTCSLANESDVRLVAAKSGIIITVADDFYDMEGSLSELNNLTNAIQRWDGKSLSGHSKTIFNVLESHVKEMAAKHLQQHGNDITTHLQHIWQETIEAWYKEAKWSRNGYAPSTKEYLELGMASIAIHTMVLPSSCFLNPILPSHKLIPPQYEALTRWSMIITRLLNDIQSYKREEKDGKSNYVLLYMKENPEANVEDSIAYIREMINKKTKQFLQHALMDGDNDLPKPCRLLHLSCLKTFNMFFNTTNRYDSDTEMIEDIQKAIYVPIQIGKLVMPNKKSLLVNHEAITKRQEVVVNFHQSFKSLKNQRFKVGAKNGVVIKPIINSSMKNMNLGLPFLTYPSFI